jgi:hypothetical protein
MSQKIVVFIVTALKFFSVILKMSANETDLQPWVHMGTPDLLLAIYFPTAPSIWVVEFCECRDEVGEAPLLLRIWEESTSYLSSKTDYFHWDILCLRQSLYAVLFFSFLGWSETESTWYVGH